jgi:8-oxo-dGTP pyrophosphatase MutT (NUDIX family)
MDQKDSQLLDEIAWRLPRRHPQKIPLGNFGRAAVLVPICRSSCGPAFLLTERTHEVETHKGQISFPGGIMDPADSSLRVTALRETWEEIGLPGEQIRILGEFDDYLSITGLVVTPFIATIDLSSHLNPNPREVAEILTVPFSDFGDSHLLRVEMRQRFDREEAVYYYDCHGKTVWGLTARMIRDFLGWLTSTSLDETSFNGK